MPEMREIEIRVETVAVTEENLEELSETHEGMPNYSLRDQLEASRREGVSGPILCFTLIREEVLPHSDDLPFLG